MTKVKPLTENQRRDLDFQEQLVGKMKSHRITYTKLADALGCSVNSLYRRRDNPETLTLREIRILRETFPDLIIQ